MSVTEYESESKKIIVYPNPTNDYVYISGIKDTKEYTIFIKSGSEFHQVLIQDIKYIESDGNYVTLHTIKRSILARYKLS
ncbi:LytTR family transcriptional regulator DNA-binding domain-containing protein [Psychroserpens ponticola]|uniref:LytTR family transcriptional regulator DNA-binding domain-containing protein n=1 Tax=Psychroserpens ponticola TaxID=2932268 RepID=UPI003743B1EE